MSGHCGKEIWQRRCAQVSCRAGCCDLTMDLRLPYSAASFMTYEHALSVLQKAFPKDENVISSKWISSDDF